MLKRSRFGPDHSEEEDASEDEPELARSRRSVPSLKLWTALAVAAVGCGLTGSKEPWALAIVAVLVAINLLIAQPRSRVSRLIVWPLMLFALLSLGSFLPLAESAWPWWRQALARDFEVYLGDLRSPQPWVSLETWLVLMMALIWLWHCLGRGFNESERRWLVRMLTLLITLLAGLAVWFKRTGVEVPFWEHREWRLGYFGPFPNRNHFGGLLAMGAVLAFATVYDSYRRRSPWWPLYSLSLVPILWALVSGTSRAGLGLFFIGLIAWMAFASFSRRSARRMGVATAVLLVFIAVAILFGQHILERASVTGSGDALSSNSRIRVWGDCLGLISTVPILGVGLGCFGAVFPFHQSYFDTVARHIHPENDGLWLAAEAGVPALLLLVMVLFQYTSRSGIWRSSSRQSGRKDRRLRNACAVATLILPLHGLADTPAHQIGLACTAALLAGLSLRARRPAGTVIPARARMTRWLLATFCCAAGAAWFAIAAGLPVLPGTSSARMLRQEARRLIDTGDLAGAQVAMNRAISMTPLQWDGYYDRAALSLARGLPPNSALEDFARARYLEPHSGLICQAEAFLWQDYHPEYAPAAWREAMRRDSSRADSFYSYALTALREHPDIRSAVRSLATTPKQKLSYLGSCGKEDFANALAELLELQPTLASFSPEERLRLFYAWFAAGDRKQLVARLEQDASWRADGWPVLAEDKAARGDFQGACQLALEHLPPPPESGGSRKTDLGLLRREFLFHPTDFNYGFVLFEAEKRNELLSDALVTLDKMSQLANAPARVLYEQSMILSRKGEHAAAWDKMKAYLDKWRIAMRETHGSIDGPVAKAFRTDAARVLKISPDP